ncbi:glycine--tRNA ligase beta subunit [Novosphingobium marinum]|uniref:Glycine--tRNA ligase beta subunit n=1 Tax=Novosphingobium marinum TaxID=1514948 RepID=A0A7Y9XTE8_9SPHN|nr:glycine--tRNA ligase subunit beta [Novosphingobium marinum]NYH94194.1 glycyl-tRNA synthetase beta chain [Novosphingobium marinum]GGC20371.1 glycine--tRNA ligase beta subunit [Novosphingobium marinum]
MSDFLLELRCEEIPARMQAGARADLERLFRKQLDEAGVAVGKVTVWSTPRRLALIARDLPAETQAVREETKGPATSAPEQALDGFLRKVGLSKDRLEKRDVKGKDTWFAVVEKPGRAVRDVLAEAIPAIVRAFPWPKSMRWGAASISTESLRWVRPLSGIVAIFGEELVPCTVGGIESGYATLGHRFHHPDEITIGSAEDYADKLRACHVIVDHEERQDLIREKAAGAARAAGLAIVEDEGLVIENAGLTEWPVPLLGRFDPEFLEVPPEVIQLTARVNQKYFVCEKDGTLADAFVCTANIDAADGGEAIVAGNRKVLAARLSDARFFWEQDRKKTLAEHAKGLERITFHEKLGTVADKVERVAKLARWLVEEGIVRGADPDMAEQAARLAKADLVTEMVGEFPELQGLMGGYYARAEGLPDAVADAIRDHYKPVGQGDEVPTAPVTVAVSLADKLDTVLHMFSMWEEPTGSKDPFALRRAAIGINSTLVRNDVRLDFGRALEISGAHYAAHIDRCPMDFTKFSDRALEDFRTRVPHQGDIHLDKIFALHLLLGARLWAFFGKRMIAQLKVEGKRPDFIEAVLYSKAGSVPAMVSRANALQDFMGTADGANLLAGYKRAANILRKEDWQGIEGEIAQTGEEDPLALVDDPDLKAVIDAKMEMRHAADKSLSYTPEPAEKDLIDALDAAEPRAAAAIEAEDFAGAMAALASLRAPIDAFFDNVTVNDPDAEKRRARLALLDRFRAAVHNVADFSKIEG